MSHNPLTNLAQLFASDPKVATSLAEAWEFQTIPTGPSGWINFAEGDICLDLFCVCGNNGHIDGQPPELVVCPGCKRSYFLNGHIQLVEVIELPEPQYEGQ